MSKSIMHDKERRYCYLCAGLHGDFSEKPELEEHHVFGGPNRKWSEKYGLKVYLCKKHHTGDITGSREAVHNNPSTYYADILKYKAQEEFEKKYGHELFVKTFGKNYL